MRTIIIGDIHGCLEEFQRLIHTLRLQPKDHLVLLGDLIDKGPDSAGVVSFARALAKSYRLSLVLGNHEESHLRWVAKEEKKRARMKRHLESQFLHTQMSLEDVEFLRTADLLVPLPEVGAVAVHAGIPEFMHEIPTKEIIAAASSKIRKRINQACRLRYVTSEGHFVGLFDIDRDKHEFWAARYDGRFGHAYYGHEHMETLRKDKHATSLDLGCVYGGKLAAAVLRSGKPEEIVTVDALEKYSSGWWPVSLEYRPLADSLVSRGVMGRERLLHTLYYAEEGRADAMLYTLASETVPSSFREITSNRKYEDVSSEAKEALEAVGFTQEMHESRPYLGIDTPKE